MVTDNVTAIWDRLWVSPPCTRRNRNFLTKHWQPAAPFLLWFPFQGTPPAQAVLHLSTDSEGRSHRHLSHTWERLMSKVWVCDPPQTAAAFHMKGRGVLLKDKGSKSVRLTLSLCRLVVAFPCATASVMVEYRGDGHRACQWPGAPAPSTFSWGLALWAGSAGSGRLRLASRHGGLPPPPCKVLDPGCWILPNEK